MARARSGLTAPANSGRKLATCSTVIGSPDLRSMSRWQPRAGSSSGPSSAAISRARRAGARDTSSPSASPSQIRSSSARARSAVIATSATSIGSVSGRGGANPSRARSFTMKK